MCQSTSNFFCCVQKYNFFFAHCSSSVACCCLHVPEHVKDFLLSVHGKNLLFRSLLFIRCVLLIACVKAQSPFLPHAFPFSNPRGRGVTHTHTHTNAHTHACAHSTHTLTHTLIHTRTHVHTRTCTHTRCWPPSGAPLLSLTWPSSLCPAYTGRSLSR